ncbi:MAG: hypothetical protein JSR84_07170 [Proteobacteria bacterium]|nr:hypothetical protein [Pseudomonadota bacterium]
MTAAADAVDADAETPLLESIRLARRKLRVRDQGEDLNGARQRPAPPG